MILFFNAHIIFSFHESWIFPRKIEVGIDTTHLVDTFSPNIFFLPFFCFCLSVSIVFIHFFYSFFYVTSSLFQHRSVNLHCDRPNNRCLQYGIYIGSLKPFYYSCLWKKKKFYTGTVQSYCLAAFCVVLILFSAILHA